MSDPRPPSPLKIAQINRGQSPTASQLQKAQRKDEALSQEQVTAFENFGTKIRNDGWANVMTGMGGPMDKQAYSFFGRYPIIPDPELERLYFGDGIGARIIDVVADDMTREWINLKVQGEEDAQEENDQTEEIAIEEVGEAMESLDAQSVFNEAVKWARLYGGSCIVMGALDGQTMDQPLNTARISGMDYLRVIDRSDIDLFQSIYQNDPNLPGFGKPVQLFMYFQVGVMRYPKLVHISRCILLKGKKIPTGATPTTTLAQRFWGLSVFNGIYESLSDYAANMSSVTNVLSEFVIGKYKMSGLASLMAEGKEGIVQARMQLISLMKYTLHSVMMDAENEDYTRDTVSMGGIAELIDRAALKVCATSGIPYTRLFGDSPGGLSTDDASGKATYYDGVRSAQHVQIKPALRRLVDVILAWKKRDVALEIEFNPLQSLTELEEAQVKLTEAQTEAAQATTYNTYMMAGVLAPEQVYALKWAEIMKGVEVVSFGPNAEAEGELTTALEAEIEKASAKNQTQTGTASPPQGFTGSATQSAAALSGGQGVGPDVIGKGMG